jgi:hypothetical protein
VFSHGLPIKKVEERLKSIEFPLKSLKPAKANHQGMNSGLGFRGFLGFRVLGFFVFLAYAIIPSSLLNIGFTAKVFLGFQNPCRRRLASNAQRVRQKRKFHYCNKICQVYIEREREREISVLCVCGF